MYLATYCRPRVNKFEGIQNLLALSLVPNQPCEEILQMTNVLHQKNIIQQNSILKSKPDTLLPLKCFYHYYLMQQLQN